MIQDFWNFIHERHAIYIRKYLRGGGDIEKMFGYKNWINYELCDPEHFAGRDPGEIYTLDPILQQYRFCNVFRELDRVTIWIRKNIRSKFVAHQDLWFMCAMARIFNWPPTLQYLMDTEGAWPSHKSFSLEKLGEALDIYKAAGHKVYTGAYMIRAETSPKKYWYNWTKQQYIAKIVLGNLWKDKIDFRDIGFGGIENAWNLFQLPKYIGWGPFMAYQVCVDLLYTRYLCNAPDIDSWAALGPGSKRGLNRLNGRKVNCSLSQETGLLEMVDLFKNQNKFKADWLPHIELSDIQNCLCEFDKWMRVRRGEGKPRARYHHGRGF